MLKSQMGRAEKLFISALDTSGLSIETLSNVMAAFTHSLIDLPDGTACNKSCSYCCHLRVGVSIPEAIVIFEQIKTNATDEGFDFLKHRVMNTAQKGDTLNERWWLKTKTPCPFLDTQGNNLCLIYELRPFSCRAYHSTDVNVCQKGFEKSETVQIPCFPLYRAFTDMHSSVFIHTMSNRGLYSYQVGFVSALNILFEAQASQKESKVLISNDLTPNQLNSDQPNPDQFNPNYLIQDWFKGKDVFKAAKLQ